MRLLIGNVARLKKTAASYLGSVLIALGWGTSFGAATLWAIFQGLLLPMFHGSPPPDGPLSDTTRIVFYYLAVLGVSTLAGIVFQDFGRALVSFAVSYLLGGAIVFLVLSAPGSTINNLRIITPDSLNLIAIDLTFRALFPLPLFVLLFGVILGTAFSERYF